VRGEGFGATKHTWDATRNIKIKVGMIGSSMRE